MLTQKREIRKAKNKFNLPSKLLPLLIGGRKESREGGRGRKEEKEPIQFKLNPT